MDALQQNGNYDVRPLTGAGIEIFGKGSREARDLVRPLTGAGIEMASAASSRPNRAFAPSRGRELKYGCVAAG